MRSLARQLANGIERCDLGGWALVVAGLAALTLAVLTPAWAELQALRHQSNILSDQVEWLEARGNAHQAFVQAVQGGEHTILRRLAWQQLHLKPLGVQVMDGDQPATVAPADSIEQWIEAAVPPKPLAEPAPPLPDTLLVRWTVGEGRPWTMALAVVCLAGGLLTSLRPAEQSDTDEV